MSAQESRRKKKDYVDSLEKQYVKFANKLCDVYHSLFFTANYTVAFLDSFCVILGQYLQNMISRENAYHINQSINHLLWCRHPTFRGA